MDIRHQLAKISETWERADVLRLGYAYGRKTHGVLVRRPASMHSVIMQLNGIALNILLVDDDSGTAKALCRLLKAYGHRVEVAYGADEGLALARDLCPDLILHDIAMSPVDGYAAARRLRQTPAIADTVLIACSGFVDEAMAREVGYDGWLHKPFSTGELETILAMAIERRRGHAGRTGRVK
jgi:CheY-like chemotaxis protein